MNTKKLLCLLLALVMTLALLAGCGSKPSEAPQGSDAEAAAPADHIFTIATSADVGDMNPHQGAAAIYAQNYVYESLVVYADGGIQPGLAESWDISEDGLTYTFHLRDAKFSDGSDFNAENVVKNFDAIFENFDSFSWMGVCSKMDKYYAVDDSTFEFVVKEPYYPILQELAAVRPFRMLGDAGFQDDGSTINGIKASIGTGPWMMTDYVENDHATFERNPYYWGEAPKLECFQIKYITDGQTAVSALEAGQVDMIYDMYESTLMSVDTYNALIAEGYASAISDPVLTRVITLNAGVAPLDDANVRKAIILGLDRQTMVDSTFGGLEELAQSYYWPGTIYCDVGLKGYEYNAEEAGKLLDEAGWTLADGAEYRTKNGEELALTYYYDASDVVQTALAQVCQSDLKKIGVHMEIVGEEYNTNINRIYSGDFQIGYTVSWGDPYDPHSTISAMVTEGGSAEYFALSACDGFDAFAENVNSIFGEVDESVIQSKYDSAFHFIEDQYCLVPISYQTNRAVAQPGVTGIAFGYSNVMPLNTIAQG